MIKIKSYLKALTPSVRKPAVIRLPLVKYFPLFFYQSEYCLPSESHFYSWDRDSLLKFIVNNIRYTHFFGLDHFFEAVAFKYDHNSLVSLSAEIVRVKCVRSRFNKIFKIW